jgi:hypothetical protein
MNDFNNTANASGLESTTYSFRAESPVDVANFILAIVQEGIFLIGSQMSSLILTGPLYSGEVTFQFESLSPLEEIRRVMRTIEDSHVMLQTLLPVPLSENRCERDFSIV